MEVASWYYEQAVDKFPCQQPVLQKCSLQTVVLANGIHCVISCIYSEDRLKNRGAERKGSVLQYRWSALKMLYKAKALLAIGLQLDDTHTHTHCTVPHRSNKGEIGRQLCFSIDLRHMCSVWSYWFTVSLFVFKRYFLCLYFFLLSCCFSFDTN